MIEKLRAQTGIQHRNLEAHLDFFNRSWTIEQYRKLLQNFYRLYHVLEPYLLSELERVGFELDYSKRLKLPLLLRDLNYLKKDRCEAENFSGSIAKNLVSSQEHLVVGILYVVEGSTLGGQVIARLIRKHLGVDASSGGSFFSAYGDQLQSNWDGFLKALHCHSNRYPEQEKMILRGASEGFSIFSQALESSFISASQREFF